MDAPITDCLCTVGDVAGRLGISKRTCYAWLEAGRLSLTPVRLSARCVRYSARQLDALIQERVREAAADVR